MGQCEGHDWFGMPQQPAPKAGFRLAFVYKRLPQCRPVKPNYGGTGFNCWTDAQNGLWRFCPAGFIMRSDYGLAGSSIEGHRSSSAFGFPNKLFLTFTWCWTGLFFP